MSLFSDIRFFVKRYTNNPTRAVAIAFLIYRILNQYMKKESMVESVKVVQSKGTKTILYDDKLQKYILVDSEHPDIWSHNKIEPLKKKLEA